MADEQPLSIVENEDLSYDTDLNQYLTDLPAITVSSEEQVTDTEEGEIHPKRKRVTAPTQQHELSPRTIDFVSPQTRRRVDSLIRNQRDYGCKICSLMSRTRTGQRYHISSHFVTHVCGCGFSHYDTRMLADHQKEKNCTPFMYAVCRESASMYSRAMNLAEDPNLVFYVYRQVKPLAPPKPSTSLATPNTDEALRRAIATLDSTADQLRAILRLK